MKVVVTFKNGFQYNKYYNPIFKNIGTVEVIILGSYLEKLLVDLLKRKNLKR